MSFFSENYIFNNCKCECHEYHIRECVDCIDAHYDIPDGEKLTFTDSAVHERIAEYFHRYGEKDKRLGSFYYEMIFSNMINDTTTVLEPQRLRFLNYLFKYKKQDTIFDLIHNGMLLFLYKNGKADITQDYDKRKKLKWRIKNED